MCPSFQATREEKYTTRGRAHLLFEMMRGDAIDQGWRSEGVREALELCLQCKGCKHDCPVSVDMATYKAEFLSHYYEGRVRPPAAYAMGLLFRWAPMAMQAPGLVNAALRMPGLATALKSAIGVAPERQAPAFAPETFQSWFRRRSGGGRQQVAADGRSRPPVILWPDTFNNYFRPRTAQAAVEVLEAAGYRVEVPEQHLCCGRPLYDYGMLDLAKRKLREAIAALRPAIRSGTPIVGLEPSCAAVFRDEMVNLFPDDEDALRLKRQVLTLSELLTRSDGYRPPRLERKAVVHAHCHHKAVLGVEAQNRLFHDMGLEFEPLNSGCCGQAGSFGYEHYDVSMAIGERVLLPAVRKAPRDALIIADGFSCREQIAHGTERRALHPAEVLQLALHEGPRGPDGDAYPERRCPQPEAKPSPGELAAAVATGALATAAFVWLNRIRRGAGASAGDRAGRGISPDSR
jgi:Fe-S oxidoreductase